MSYSRMAFDKHTLKSVSVEILCFRGQRENPRWMDIDPGALVVHRPKTLLDSPPPLPIRDVLDTLCSSSRYITFKRIT